MLQNGPAIDPAIMQRTVNAAYKDIKAMLTLPSLIDFGKTYSTSIRWSIPKRSASRSRNPIVFEYVRRPSYYAIFNSGKIVSSLHCDGLGALWNAEMGTVLQAQGNSDSQGWGMRAAGSLNYLMQFTATALAR